MLLQFLSVAKSATEDTRGQQVKSPSSPSLIFCTWASNTLMLNLSLGATQHLWALMLTLLRAPRGVKHCACLPSQRVINHNSSTRGSVQSYDTTITFITVYNSRERVLVSWERKWGSRWPADADVHWLHHPLPWQKENKENNQKTKPTEHGTVGTHKTSLPRQSVSKMMLPGLLRAPLLSPPRGNQPTGVLHGPVAMEAVNITVHVLCEAQSSEFLRYRTVVAVKKFLLIKTEFKQSERNADCSLQNSFKNTELSSPPSLQMHQTQEARESRPPKLCTVWSSGCATLSHGAF